MPEWTGPTIEIVDWKRYQHYHTRRPPWIKLYLTLLDDESYERLDAGSKTTLLYLWLLRARVDKPMPLDATWLMRRIPGFIASHLTSLQEDGWIFMTDASKDASKPASGLEHSMRKCAIPETETETETETESCRKATLPPDGGETVSGDLKSRRNGILIYYLKAFRKSRYDLTLPRKRILDEALQNFDDETIRQTIDLFATHKAYAFHRGETESSNGRKYTGLCEYILAKGSKVSVSTRIQEILETGGYEVVDDES